MIRSFNGQSGAGMMYDSWHSLANLASAVQSRCGAERVGGGVAGSLRDGGADGGAPVPEFVTPPSNTGVNKILSGAQGIK